jgi:hypothetical protein
MTKVNLEVAKAEFEKWVEAKKIPEKAIEKHEDDAEYIIDAIQSGVLTIDDDFTLVHKLEFPKGELSQLRYKPRVSKGELSASTRGLKADNLIGEMAICYISCLTGESRGAIRSLDSVDSSLGEHIAAFFLI